MKTKIEAREIQQSIFLMRGLPVMIDSDLAKVFGTTTKRVNEIVKRNSTRFPKEYLFRLNASERIELVANCDRLAALKHSSSLPYCFTEHGVAMLATLLRSELAVQMSIQIINSFVQYRRSEYLIQDLHLRISDVESSLKVTNHRVDEIFTMMRVPDALKSGIFFNDQIFDAYVFACDLIQRAKISIILIDNYIDESTLVQLSKRRENVTVMIYTKNITKKIELDLVKYNTQYPELAVRELTEVHDRFLIIDHTELYHIGASLKDLGKKWFAFSRMDSILPEILSKLH